MSKRPLEKDIVRERYLYVRFCEDDGPDGVTRTTLSFADKQIPLGARLHETLVELLDPGEDAIIIDMILDNLRLPLKERDFSSIEFADETIALLAQIGPECVERRTTGQFGSIKNGLYYIVSG